MCALGSVWHFIFEWSGQQAWVGSFCPVNESTWEHLKLLFFPAVIYSAAEWIWARKRYPNLLAARTISILLGMIAITTFFYTYTGVLGYDVMWLDILTFIFGVLVTFLYTHYDLKRLKNKKYVDLLCLILLAAIFALFVVFTYAPPHIGFFRDPVTGLFGMAV